MFTPLFILASAVIVHAASIETRQRSGCPDLSPCGGSQFVRFDNSVYPYECVYVRGAKGPGTSTMEFSCFFDNRGILSGTAAKSSDDTCPVQSYLPCRPRVDITVSAIPPPAVTTPVTPPSDGGRALHPTRDFGKCLDVRGNARANGTPVQLYTCNGSGAQSWVWNRANTKIRLAGTNFCLDAGSNIGSGVGMKIWTCYDGLAAQAWYATDDARFAVTGKGQCLDVTNGNFQDSNQVQTWACGNGNANQAWSA